MVVTLKSDHAILSRIFSDLHNDFWNLCFLNFDIWHEQADRKHKAAKLQYYVLPLPCLA